MKSSKKRLRKGQIWTRLGGRNYERSVVVANGVTKQRLFFCRHLTRQIRSFFHMILSITSHQMLAAPSRSRKDSGMYRSLGLKRHRKPHPSLFELVFFISCPFQGIMNTPSCLTQPVLHWIRQNCPSA